MLVHDKKGKIELRAEDKFVAKILFKIKVLQFKGQTFEDFLSLLCRRQIRNFRQSKHMEILEIEKMMDLFDYRYILSSFCTRRYHEG